MIRYQFRELTIAATFIFVSLLASCGGASESSDEETFEKEASEAALAVVAGLWLVDYTLINDSCGLDIDEEGSVRRFQIQVQQAGPQVLVDGVIPGEVTDDGFFARGSGPISECPDGSQATSIITQSFSELDGDTAESLFFVQVPCPSEVCERTREGTATRVP